MLAYSHYGCKPLFKAVSWAAGAVLAVLIIAARKHYTVDVVIAWYTVPMVYTLLHVWWHYKNAARSGVCGLCGGHSSCSYNCTAGEDEKSDMQAPGTGIGSRKGLGFNNTSSSNGGSDSSGSAVCEIILPTSGGTFGGVGSPSGSSGGGKGKSRAAAAAASPRRLLGPWWFGRGPWRQQLQRHVQQLAKADSGAAVDMEAQVCKQVESVTVVLQHCVQHLSTISCKVCCHTAYAYCCAATCAARSFGSTGMDSKVFIGLIYVGVFLAVVRPTQHHRQLLVIHSATHAVRTCSMTTG